MAGGGQVRPMGGSNPLTGQEIANVATSGASPLMSGGKGGGSGAMPRAMPSPAPSTQYSPMAAPAPTAAPTAAPAQPQGFNVNQAAAGGLQKAFQGTEAAMQAPNIGQFMNPYTRQVTQNTLTDLERQRQMQMNTLGAQASNAKAFGGSRHGVAEALTNEGFARQGAQTLATYSNKGLTQLYKLHKINSRCKWAELHSLANLGNKHLAQAKQYSNSKLNKVCYSKAYSKH